MFIPRHMRSFKRQTRSFCRYCCRRDATKKLYKLREGPLDWYFCNEEHALDWLEHRYRDLRSNRLLSTLPHERAALLCGQTIEEVLHKLSSS